MRLHPLALALSAALHLLATAQTTPTNVPVKELGTVTVTSGRPSSLPTQIPTTIESVTGAQIEQTIRLS